MDRKSLSPNCWWLYALNFGQLTSCRSNPFLSFSLCTHLVGGKFSPPIFFFFSSVFVMSHLLFQHPSRLSVFPWSTNWNGFQVFKFLPDHIFRSSSLASYQPNLKCFSMKKTKMEKRINSIFSEEMQGPFFRQTTDDFFDLLKDMITTWSCTKIIAQCAKRMNKQFLM